MEKKNIWLERFEQADEQGKLDLIWEVAHTEYHRNDNGASRRALHVMLRWLADYTLENVPVDDDDEMPEADAEEE